MGQSRRRAKERNKTLIGWAAAVFAVFWGIWWGFLVNELLGKPSLVLGVIAGRSVDTHQVLVLSAFYVGLFTVSFVAWLWDIRLSVRRSFLRRALECLGVWLGFLGLVFLFVKVHGLPDVHIWYGTALTALWFVVPLLVVVRRY